MLKLSTLLPPPPPGGGGGGERVRFAQLILCDLARVTKKLAVSRVRPRFASYNTQKKRNEHFVK